MPRPVDSVEIPPNVASALRRNDLGLARSVMSAFAVAVVFDDANAITISAHDSIVDAIPAGAALAITLADVGQHSAGVAVLSANWNLCGELLFSGRTCWLVADVAAVITFARFLAWLDVQLEIRAMRGGAYDQPRAQTSNLERFGQLVGQGFPADAAAAIATGRVQ